MQIGIYQIRPLGQEHTFPRWRLASALVPVSVATFTVTREEDRVISPGHALLLETLRVLDRDAGHVKVSDVAKLSGIGDEARMAGILVPMAEQGLVHIDGERVRQNPLLTIDGQGARVLVEREEQVCLIGTPPVPCHGIDSQRLERLDAFENDTAMETVREDVLEHWRRSFWDSGARRLLLQSPLRARLYVLEGAVGDELHFRDERDLVPVRLPEKHPFGELLESTARAILNAAASLLEPYGNWNAERSELHCTGEQWIRWRAAQGYDVSEVILRGAMDVAICVQCHPADAAAALAMLIEKVLEELDRGVGPCTREQVERVTEQLKQSPVLRGTMTATPTLAEIESAAWDAGRWELAYRIASVADRI